MSPAPTTKALLVAGAVVSALVAGGCAVSPGSANLVNGKKQFVAKCGSCHTLARAGTTGIVGPNLDESMSNARKVGFGETTFRGLVEAQIRHPNVNAEHDPMTGKAGALMPANLVKGRTVLDVATYVSKSVAKPGKDAGQLGTIGAKKAAGAAKATGGKVTIPADPGGSLAFQYASATATAGALEIDTPNKSSVDHNIAIEGNGVDKQGPVVKNGGVSKLTVTLKPGKYTFYCAVPGHREAGMKGTLTVS